MKERNSQVDPPQVGAPAPELALPTIDGGNARLADLRDRPVLVVFLRHAGCLFCRTHLVKLLKRRERIEAAGVGLAAVVHDEPDRVRSGMLRNLDMPYPVLVDLERSAYRAWGLGRASALGTFLSPRVALGYAKFLFRDREPLIQPGRDMLQLGGDFVIDAGGRVTYSHPQSDVDDRPPAGLLIQELEQAAQPAT